MKKGEMLNAAIVLAANGHAGQYDRGGTPYILHPLAVLNILNSKDEVEQVAAVLHDCAEDTNVTYQDMRDVGVSEAAINIITLLTKQPGQTYEEYQQGIFSNVSAMRVKAADLTHNSDIRRLKGVSEKDIARMAKYHEFYLQIQTRLDNIDKNSN